MSSLWWSLLYIAVHFLAYSFVLRNWHVVHTERGIFLYHLVSAVVFTCCGVALTFTGYISVTSLGLMVAIHGIYSVSFLELWSLAQGGYSVSILLLARNTGAISRQHLAKLVAIGDEKRRERLNALLAARLVARENGVIRLTARGQLLANLLMFIVRTTNVQKKG